MKTIALVATVIVFALCVVAGFAGEWEPHEPPNGPPPRAGHSLTTVRTDVYLFGGLLEGQGAANDLWMWDRPNKLWVPITPLNTPPPARSFHGAAPANGRLFVGYGLDQNGDALGDLWQYDPAANAWTELEVIGNNSPGEVPQPHSYGGMTGLFGGKIFIAGGFNDDFMEVRNAYILHPGGKGNTVPAQHIESLNPPRYGFVAVSSPEGYPMMIGGEEPVKSGPRSDVMVWNPDPAPWGIWENVTITGETVLPRTLPGAAQWVDQPPTLAKRDWDAIIIIVGGESPDKAAGSAETQYFDASGNTWSYGDDMPQALSSLAAAILPPLAGETTAHLITFGGRTIDGDLVDTTLEHSSDVEVENGETLYVTAAAHVEGVGGTNWVTDIEAHNRGTTATECSFDLLVRDQANPSPESTTFTVEPGESRRFEDVLLTSFSKTGAAALRVNSDGTDLLVTSRTYNLIGEGNPDGLPAGATFGQFIPGVSEDGAIDFGEEARLVQLSNSADPEVGFRTNIGFVNVTDTQLVIEADLYTGQGGFLMTVSKDLAAYEYTQVTAIYDQATDIDVESGFAIIRTTTDGGQFFAYASVVDNLTGDPTYIEPQTTVGTSGAVITAAAHASGVGGTNWRSDVVLHNPTDADVECWMLLAPRGQDNSTMGVDAVSVPTGESVLWTDALETVFEFEGAAAIKVSENCAELIVTSRTYNLLGEGNELGLPVGATFGQFIPAVPLDDAVGSNDELRLIQLSWSADENTGFRTNIGFVNAVFMPIDLVVELYDSAGNLLGTVPRTLAAFENQQVTDIFSKVTSTDVADGFAIVKTTTSGGSIFAYASVVDNITGDPIYIPGM